MAHLAHTALYVTDLDRAKGFYETYLGAEAGEEYHNFTTGLHTHFLTFDGGSRLEIMERPGVEQPREGATRGLNHVAFSLGSKEAVDALTDRLAEDGFHVVNGPRTTGTGFYESVVLDPEGNELELTA
ncbi:MAG: VOC family protein [Mobilicoccus sp.]|nr:VOC family protein [Mobilicoccus sp.]